MAVHHVSRSVIVQTRRKRGLGLQHLLAVVASSRRFRCESFSTLCLQYSYSIPLDFHDRPIELLTDSITQPDANGVSTDLEIDRASMYSDIIMELQTVFLVSEQLYHTVLRSRGIHRVQYDPLIERLIFVWWRRTK
jgi:hypothetical protein